MVPDGADGLPAIPPGPHRPPAHPSAPSEAPDAESLLLIAALSRLGLQELPATPAALAKAVGPLVTPERWSFDHSKAYQVVFAQVMQATAARRRQEQGQQGT